MVVRRADVGMTRGAPGRLPPVPPLAYIPPSAGAGVVEAAIENVPDDQWAVEPRWFACYTKARHEKRVAAAFEQRSMETYLPVLVRLRQWKDRRRLVEFPMFPSYVFVRALPEDLPLVTTVPGVCSIVRNQGEPVSIPVAELENVRRFAAGLREAGSEPEPATYLAEGQRVEVTAGPFQGVRGVVVEHRNRRRVVVGLRAIGQGMEVDVEASILSPIAEP